MTDAPKPTWEVAMDFGLETGRYILIGDADVDWRDAPMHTGPNFYTAPLHPNPVIAAEQQVIDNMLVTQERRQALSDAPADTDEGHTD